MITFALNYVLLLMFFFFIVCLLLLLLLLLPLGGDLLAWLVSYVRGETIPGERR